MKTKQLLAWILSFICFTSLWAKPALAVTTPTFPSCANPQGVLKVSYSTGTHGIAGDTSSYTGSDVVYTLSEDTLTQCFCSDTGKGIQTNWWKISSLTQEEIDILKNLGWVFIPDGTAWGLSAAPYMAQNETYSCRSDSNGGSSSSSSSSSNGSVASAATTVAGQVLGLAYTGGIKEILGLFATGLVLVVLGKKLQSSK